MSTTPFTPTTFNDTILSIEEILEDSLYMNTQIRFFDQHSMYLYCTVEQETATQIKEAINNHTLRMTLTLYETPNISQAMAVNIQHPTTLKIPVNLYGSPKEKIYYYDELTMTPLEIKNKFKCSIEKYKEKCVYTRCLVTEPKSKIKVIEYKIYNPSIIKGIK